MQWFVLAVAALMYLLVIIFPHRKSWISLGAALLLVVVGAVPFAEAVGVHVNWNVLMIFVGSLVIAELFIYSRVPARIADEIIERTPNVGVAIVAILMMTGLISAFVENVATVLVMAPIALALSAKLKMNPTYFMVGLAVMANLQGTATLVGDPPSMIFASYAGYTFNDFFVFAGKPSIFFAVQVGMLAGALFFYRFFARTPSAHVELNKDRIVSWVPTILLIAMIVGLAATSFMHSGGGVSLLAGLLVVALAIIGIFWYAFVRTPESDKPLELVKKLDWDTTAFLVGIFIVIGGLASTGLLEDFAALLGRFVGGNVLLGFVVIVLVSTLISGFVDNVPYIIVMLPVAATLSKGLGLAPELYMFALLVGSCMGGNLTPFGASANVVAVGILRKQNLRMNFADWLKIGLPFTLLTTAASSVFIWLVWR